MNKIETAVMWIDTNISFTQAHIILRHLYAKFKTWLQVPFPWVSNLGVNECEPTFGEYLNQKQDVNVPHKLVQYWTCCPCDLLEYDFKQLISSKVLNNSSSPPSTTFRYKSKVFLNDKKGGICVIGLDHRAGRSRYTYQLFVFPFQMMKQ